MWNKLQVYSKPSDLRDPVLLVSVSTSNPQYVLLYSQARELGKFLVSKLDFRLIASLYSSALAPEVQVSADGIADLISNNFYLHHGKDRDYLLFAGHASPMGDEYEYSDIVLSFAKSLGVKELVSFGARWSEETISPYAAPKVLGFSTDKTGTERLEECEVEILKNESALFFANTIVAMSKFYDIRGYKLSVDHGEPSPHPKSLIAFIEVLAPLTGLNVDTSDLQKESKQLAEAIKRAEKELPSEQGEEGKYRDDRDLYR
ncbi:MAG: PAC2 family protein [Nitrososphaerota archaeon]|nr:PAC2 family protein [Nitrososphaerota archaeon]